jgi:outer membrane protein assembly factor BamB
MHGIIRNRVVLAGLVLFFFCLAAAAGCMSGTSNVPSIQGNLRGANATGNSDKSGDEWPMFRGGLSNNGTTTTTAASSTAPFWTYTGTTSVFSGAVVAGGRVFAPTADSMYCFNATTGALIWKNLTMVGGIDGSCAIAGGLVYVGVTSTVDKVYCLNATTGWTKWTYNMAGDIHSSPAVSGGNVYIGDNAMGLTLLNASNGFYKNTYNTGSTQGAPAVVGGRVYISNNHNIVCLNAANLAVIWIRAAAPVGWFLTSTPTVYGSAVYVAANRLICLATSDGSVLWNSSTTAPSLSPGGYGSPAAAGGCVYIGSGSAGAGVYCLNAATGAILWNTPITGYQDSTPSISLAGVTGVPERLYIGSSNKVLYCLNATTGTSLWTYTTGGRITCSPAITNGRVYIGSEDFKVYCLPMILTALPTSPPPDIAGSPLPFVMGVMVLAITGIVVRARRRHYLVKKP